MNYQRITINIPKNVYDDLLTIYGKGKISEAMSEAAERQVLRKKLEPKDPIKAFFAHRKNLPKLTNNEIIEAIHKGRT